MRADSEASTTPTTPTRTTASARAARGARAAAARLGGLVPARLRGGRGGKGTAEVSVVVVTAALAAGVFFGQGVSRTAVEVADGLTWLSDSPTGDVIQVNPATGQPEYRMSVADPGDDIDLAQYDGRLFVTNHTSGELMSFDLTSILESGQRRLGGSSDVEVLADDGSVFLVDQEASTIAALDPVTTDTVGEIWVSEAGLADVALDRSGAVWALEDDGTLHELDWTDDEQRFDEQESDTVELSGPESVLVAHDRGVTVFGPDQGVVASFGTGDDRSGDAPKLVGELRAPEWSPTELVPVAVGESGTVVVSTPDDVLDVDVSSIGCSDPGTPEVFHDVVFVPCIGDAKVVQLAPDGTRARPDIEVPGVDSPELVLDDDNLLINTPGVDTGIVVHEDGTIDPIDRYDDDAPVTAPSGDPTSPLDGLLDGATGGGVLGGDDDEPSPGPAPGSPSTGPDGPSSGPGGPGSPDDGDGDGDEDGDGCRGSRCNEDPGPTLPSGPGDPDAPLTAPTSVKAAQVSEGQVQVTWTHSGTPAPSAFSIESTDGSELARGLKASTRQAVVTVPVGETLSVVVVAHRGSEDVASAASAPLETTGAPAAPSIRTSSTWTGDASALVLTVEVTWTPPDDGGSAITGYTVSGTSYTSSAAPQSTDGDGRKASLTFPACSVVDDAACGTAQQVTVQVVAANDVGAGDTATSTFTSSNSGVEVSYPGRAQLVKSSSHKWSDADNGVGTTTLTLQPPQDWATFPGTCTWDYDGPSTGTQSGTIPCGAKQVQISIQTGRLAAPGSGETHHSIIFKAVADGGSADSQRYYWTTDQPVCDDEGCS